MHTVTGTMQAYTVVFIYSILATNVVLMINS